MGVGMFRDHPDKSSSPEEGVRALAPSLRVSTAILAVCSWGADPLAAEVVTHPFLGVTHIVRTETSPRNVRMNIVLVDLTVPTSPSS